MGAPLVAEAAGAALESGPMGAPGAGSTAPARRPRWRAREQARAMLEQDRLAAPAVAYRIVRVSRVDGAEIELDGKTIHAPVLTGAGGELQAVAAAVCTLGAAIERRITALFAARQPSLALALEDIGNEMLFRLADRSVATIRRSARRQGYASGNEVSPGDPGLALDLQNTVLELAGAARIAVSAPGAAMLFPVKSLSMLVALGRGLGSRPAPGRCDCCPSRDRCRAK